jgi:hypothetical protein
MFTNPPQSRAVMPWLCVCVCVCKTERAHSLTIDIAICNRPLSRVATITSGRQAERALRVAVTAGPGRLQRGVQGV